MKTAVPGTRTGGLDEMFPKKRSSGKVCDLRRSAKMARPLFQVVIRVKISKAALIGNHPPSKNLVMFAPKKQSSTDMKNAQVPNATMRDQPQRPLATK